MLKSLLISAAALLAASVANAQEAVFKVLASNGQNVTVTGAKNANLAAGVKLYKNETITMPGKAYVGLMHRTGRTVELSAPGSYKVDELDSKIMANARNTVGKRFSNYVFGEMTKQEEQDLKKNHQQYMPLTGAVMRATGKPAAIKPLIPATAALPNRPYTISWLAAKTKPVYVLTISNMYNEVVHTAQTSDTSVVVDFANVPQLANEKMCLVKVSAKDRPELVSNEHALKFLSTDQAAPVLKELGALDAEEGTETPLQALAQAIYFEQNDLNLDALSYYKKAMDMAPEVEDFRNQYLNFLVRTGLMTVANK